MITSGQQAHARRTLDHGGSDRAMVEAFATALGLLDHRGSVLPDEPALAPNSAQTGVERRAMT